MSYSDLLDPDFNLNPDLESILSFSKDQEIHLLGFMLKFIDTEKRSLEYEIIQILLRKIKTLEENRFTLFTELEKNIISTGLHSLTTLPKAKSTPEGKKALLKMIKEISSAFEPRDEFYKSETWLNTSQTQSEKSKKEGGS
jgi:hypothetical protein